ncbi:MAG TPA: hypothetical protein EYP52_04770 [Anaerolineae bacterium]|nr:hypothetical protein [Anaerolineae bacterium]
MLLGVTVLAAALRFVALGQIPPGLYHDEAYNGLDGLEVLAGRWMVYFPANYGREPLYIYLTALSLALFGRTPVALRLAAAVVGTLTVPITTLLARSWFGKRVGWLSGAVLAVTLWHVHLSRVAFRAVTMPLWAALALLVGGRAWRRGGWGWWLLAGFVYGLGFYTYLAVRLTPVVLLLWVVLLLARGKARRLWQGAIWFGLGVAIALAPLVGYAVGHWAVVMGRPGSVSVFNPVINHGDLMGTILRHLIRTLGMFFVRGDRIPRHNFPGRPVFDPVLGLAFVGGMVWAVVRARRRLAPAFLLTWVGLMLVPTWLAEDAPHFLRAVGVLPLAAVLPALGLAWAWERLEQAGRGRLGLLLVLLALLAGLGSTVWDYFVRYPALPEVHYFFEEAATRLAADVNRFLGSGWDGGGWTARRGEPISGRQAYIERRLWEEWAAVPFLVPFPEQVATRPEEMVPGADTVLLVLWPHEDYRDRLALLPAPARVEVWEGPEARGDLDPAPFTAYIAFAAGPVGGDREPVACFEEGICLLEAQVVPEERIWRLELVWTIRSPVSADYTVFVHLRDAGGIVDQDDRDPAGGYFPTTWWRVGDQVVDVHRLVPSGTWNGSPYLAVGLYLRSTLERLAVVNEEGQAIGDEVVLPVPAP